MKNLILLRHAKSSWKNINIDDHDRPLNKRGMRAAPIMGQRLSIKKKQPELIISSPARRAYNTSKIVAKLIGYPVIRILKDSTLYHASSEQIQSIISQSDDKYDCVMIVGHNPGITILCNHLLKKSYHIDNIPTTGMVTFNLDIQYWQQILEPNKEIKLIDYDYPKLASIIKK